MLLIFTIIGVINNKIVVIRSVTPRLLESNLLDKFGSDYYSIYDYKYIPIGDYSIVFPKMSKVSTSDVPEFNGSREDIVQQSIEYVKSFEYTKYNSSPRLMKLLGEGNCQALSLTFKGILDSYGIENTIIGSDSHVFNEVNLGDKVYTIDFSNNKILTKERKVDK